jgi:GNAT superfamily N-acetyltransferase
VAKRDRPLNVAIRPARVGDGAELVRLWLDEAAHLVELDPDRFRMPETDGLADLFNKRLAEDRPGEGHFVAELGGKLVGSVLVLLIPPMPNAERQILRELGETRAEVPSLGVESTFRRQGIGRLLMSEADAWARAQGAANLKLDTYARSPVSNPFYRDLGFAPVSIVYERVLAPS